MVKLKNPLSSLGAVGRLGEGLTFLRRRRQNIAEKTPILKDVKSAGQLSWRHMYQKCAALWHTLSAAEKQEWESLARSRHMTGFAWFQSQCLRPNPGIYLPLQGGTMQGDIDMATNRIRNLPGPLAGDEPVRLIDYVTFILPYLYNEGARAYHNTFQAIPDVTETALALNSERWDTDAIHDTVTNNSRLTCKTAGKYVITGGVYWEGDPAGIRSVNIRLNGTTPIVHHDHAGHGDYGRLIDLTTIWDLGVGDYVELMVYQSSGGALNVTSSAARSPEFSMFRIGA